MVFVLERVLSLHKMRPCLFVGTYELFRAHFSRRPGHQAPGGTAGTPSGRRFEGAVAGARHPPLAGPTRWDDGAMEVRTAVDSLPGASKRPVANLSEEHGAFRTKADDGGGGQRDPQPLRVVSNMLDEVHGVRGGAVEVEAVLWK